MYFEVLPQEHVTYIFESDESNISGTCTFVNGKLRSMFTNKLAGWPLTTRLAPHSSIEMAKEFLKTYQTYSGASYYDILQNMIDDVEFNKNFTKTSENIMFKATFTSNATSFRWEYCFDSGEAQSKCVALNFENGFLDYFVNTWSIYSIGNTELTISEEEAIKIAITAAEKYSWNVSMGENNPSVTVTEFNIVGVIETKMSFANYATKNESRDTDPLTLYPCWQIKLYFDKLYSGRVYGLDIGLWADTGELHDIRTLMWTGEDPTEEKVNNDETTIELNSNKEPVIKTDSTLWLAFPIAGVLFVGLVYSKTKLKHHENHKKLKSSSVKFSAVLLCFLISLTMFSMIIAMPKVNASDYVMPLYGSTWNITWQEAVAANSLVSNMESNFETYANYTCYDLLGSATQKTGVLNAISYYETNFDHVALFHYGHAGKQNGHWDYFDDDGPYSDSNLIWDHEIYDRTVLSKHFFVILWSCRQGDTIYDGTDGDGVKGMPYAWFYGSPTAGDCFIGFYNASMPLTQRSSHNTLYTYKLWLDKVVYYLTQGHYTIINALNQASQDYFARNYYDTELDDGFYAIWPNIGSDWGWMKIYGNTNIQVY